MGDSERSTVSSSQEVLVALAQKACALVDADIKKPEDVKICFGASFEFGVITCIWSKLYRDGSQTDVFSYFYHPECCSGLKNEGGIPRLCVQTVMSSSPPYVTTPNEWYEIQGISTENPVAKRIEV